MPKIKISVLIGLVLCFWPLASVAAADNLADESALPAATFEAEKPESAEVADLKKSLAALKAELSDMKNGMKSLQTKVLESEIEKLRDQLAAIQGDDATNSPSSSQTNLGSFNIADLISEATGKSSSVETTPRVTKIEDFVGFDVGNDVKKANSEDANVAEILKNADAEIAKLEAALGEKETGIADKAAQSEVQQKVSELKAAKAKLESVSIADAVGKLDDGADKPTSIIANADGEILFQFPRSVSQKTNDPSEQIGAANLKADLLATDQSSDLKRSAAPTKSWQIFSATNLTIFALILSVGLAVFVFWLVRYEHRLLAATSRRFQQLDFKPNFDLNTRAEQQTQNQNTRSDQNIIR
ncbi:MAG: hypothetical protein V1936_04455 [Patescibacteria group bacterium]